MSTQWYVKIDGKQYGPVSAAQLKQWAGQGRIEPTTPIRQGTAGEWLAAGRVKGLFAPPTATKPATAPATAASGAKPPRRDVAPSSSIAVGAGVSPTAEPRGKTIRMIWIAAAGGVLALFLLAGVIVLSTLAFVSWRRSAAPGWRPTSSEQGLAAIRIKELGGKLRPNTKRPEEVMIYLDNTPVTDDDLEQIQCIKGTTILSLSSTQISDDGMRHLGNLNSLYMLVLNETEITDAGLAHLYRLQSLKKLYLDSTPITDAGLVHLGRLTGLEELRLRDTQVTGEGLKKLQQTLPECKILVTTPLAGSSETDHPHVESLEEKGRGTDADELTREEVIAEIKKFRGGFSVDTRRPGHPVISVDLFAEEVGDKEVAFLRRLRKLQRLRLAHTKVTDDGLVHLKELKDLQSLFLADTQVTDIGLVHLKGLTNLQELALFETQITGDGLVHLKGMADLRTLWLGDTRVTDAGLEHVKAFVRLRTLDLYNTPITDAGLAHLGGLTGLEKLGLRKTRVTDAGLEHLRKLTQLRELDLNSTQVTEDGVKKLQEVLPNCEIHL